MFDGTVFRFLLALLFGAAVGLERESSNRDDTRSAGGIRTYTLVSLLGALSGLFSVSGLANLSILITATFFVFVLIYYLAGSFVNKSLGMTTELAIVFTFLIGFLSMTDVVPLKLVVALFVVLILVLSLKAKTKKFVSHVDSGEVESFISYAIIALVVLPFLPNVGYRLADIPVLSELLLGFGGLVAFADLELVNPQKIWFVVALITGIDIVGYILARLVGSKRSFILSSAVGGLISSTSTTQSLALKSRTVSATDHLVGAAVIANLASFFQIILIVGPLNGEWLVYLAPVIFTMIIVAGVIAGVFLSRKIPSENLGHEQKDDRRIFSLIPALKFAALLLVVSLITRVSLILFGESGFILSSILASLVGIDAVMVNLADMAGDIVTFKFALLTFLLVNATNLLSKTAYSFIQGRRQFATKFFVAMSVIIVTSFLVLFVV